MSKHESAAVTLSSKSNFLASFRFLPAEKREALYSVYAWCRQTDDIADSPGSPEEKSQKLARRLVELDAAFEKQPVTGLTAELAKAVKRFSIPKTPFLEMTEAMKNDIDGFVYRTWEDLIDYCHGVAATVGLMAIEIFGYQNPKTRDFAKNLGIALQLTNIVRDVKKDAAVSRIYIPSEMLQKHGVTEREIFSGEYSDAFAELMNNFAEKAESYYRGAKMILPDEDLKNMRPSLIMGEIYYLLLKKMRKRKFNVFKEDIKLSGMEKWRAAVKAWLFPGKTLC